MIEKYILRKTVRIRAWILRFAKNSRNRASDCETGPLKTKEIASVETWWLKQVQHEVKKSEVKRKLDLQENEAKVLECRSRIEGEYPIYLALKSRRYLESTYINTYIHTTLFQHANPNSISILISMEGGYKNTYKRDNYLQNYYDFAWILLFFTRGQCCCFFCLIR